MDDDIRAPGGQIIEDLEDECYENLGILESGNFQCLFNEKVEQGILALCRSR